MRWKYVSLVSLALKLKLRRQINVRSQKMAEHRIDDMKNIAI